MNKNYNNNKSVEINYYPNLPDIPDHSYRVLILVVQDQEKIMSY